MLVSYPDAAKSPPEGALERDRYSQCNSSEEDENDIFGWPYDDSEESEEETEAGPTESSQNGSLDHEGQLEDQEQKAEMDDPSISPYISDIEDSSPTHVGLQSSSLKRCCTIIPCEGDMRAQ